MAAAYLTLQDLYNLVGSNRVLQFFDDDLDESIADQSTETGAILEMAEAHVASFMLRAYNADDITTVANNDPAFKSHAAWIALQFASERRPEFGGVDGQGAFQNQFERAETFFDRLSKGGKRTLGEANAGDGANTGGTVQPPLTNSTDPRFVFAPDNNAPTGHGGY